MTLGSCYRKKNARQNVLDMYWKTDSEGIDWTVSYYDPERTYCHIIDADKVRKGAVIFYKNNTYSDSSSIYVRFDDVVVYLSAETEYHQMLITELIKIRDRL